MPDEVTKDGFLDNSFFVLQAKAGAHRSGMDAVLLAASVPASAKGVCADFGAGAGVAGMAVAKRASGLSCLLIESHEPTAQLCKKSIELGENASLRHRLEARRLDLTLRGQQRREAGLDDNAFDWIIANPPYNDISTFQAPPDLNKAKAHMMEHDLLEQWVETARVTLKHKGQLRFILRPQNLAEILNYLASGFGAITILPITSFGDEPANRIIIGAKKGSKASLKLLPPFILHEKQERSVGFKRQADRVMRGWAGLDMN